MRRSQSFAQRPSHINIRDYVQRTVSASGTSLDALIQALAPRPAAPQQASQQQLQENPGAQQPLPLLPGPSVAEADSQRASVLSTGNGQDELERAADVDVSNVIADDDVQEEAVQEEVEVVHENVLDLMEADRTPERQDDPAGDGQADEPPQEPPGAD